MCFTTIKSKNKKQIISWRVKAAERIWGKDDEDLDQGASNWNNRMVMDSGDIKESGCERLSTCCTREGNQI
jgi:hypothetical protein